MAALVNLVTLVETPAVDTTVHPVTYHLLEIFERTGVCDVAGIGASHIGGACLGVDIPSFGRRRGHSAVMAEHTVENHIYATAVGLGHQLVKLLFSAEFGVNLEIVCAEVTRGLQLLASLAIGGVEDRSHPEGVHSEFLDIVKRVDDTTQVAILAVSLRAPHVSVTRRATLSVLERAYHHLVYRKLTMIAGQGGDRLRVIAVVSGRECSLPFLV